MSRAGERVPRAVSRAQSALKGRSGRVGKSCLGVGVEKEEVEEVEVVEVTVKRDEGEDLGISFVPSCGPTRSLYKVKRVLRGGVCGRRAGVEPGDLLLQCNGHSLTGLTRLHCLHVLQAAGPWVTLTLLRHLPRPLESASGGGGGGGGEGESAAPRGVCGHGHSFFGRPSWSETTDLCAGHSTDTCGGLETRESGIKQRDGQVVNVHSCTRCVADERETNTAASPAQGKERPSSSSAAAAAAAATDTGSSDITIGARRGIQKAATASPPTPDPQVVTVLTPGSSAMSRDPFHAPPPFWEDGVVVGGDDEPRGESQQQVENSVVVTDVNRSDPFCGDLLGGDFCSGTPLHQNNSLPDTLIEFEDDEVNDQQWGGVTADDVLLDLDGGGGGCGVGGGGGAAAAMDTHSHTSQTNGQAVMDLLGSSDDDAQFRGDDSLLFSIPPPMEFSDSLQQQQQQGGGKVCGRPPHSGATPVTNIDDLLGLDFMASLDPGTECCASDPPPVPVDPPPDLPHHPPPSMTSAGPAQGGSSGVPSGDVAAGHGSAGDLHTDVSGSRDAQTPARPSVPAECPAADVVEQKSAISEDASPPAAPERPPELPAEGPPVLPDHPPPPLPFEAGDVNDTCVQQQEEEEGGDEDMVNASNTTTTSTSTTTTVFLPSQNPADNVTHISVTPGSSGHHHGNNNNNNHDTTTTTNKNNTIHITDVSVTTPSSSNVSSITVTNPRPAPGENIRHKPLVSGPAVVVVDNGSLPSTTNIQFDNSTQETVVRSSVPPNAFRPTSLGITKTVRPVRSGAGKEREEGEEVGEEEEEEEITPMAVHRDHQGNQLAAPSPPDTLGRKLQPQPRKLDEAAKRDLQHVLSGMREVVRKRASSQDAGPTVVEQEIVPVKLSRREAVMARDVLSRWVNKGSDSSSLVSSTPPPPPPAHQSCFQKAVGAVVSLQTGKRPLPDSCVFFTTMGTPGKGAFREDGEEEEEEIIPMALHKDHLGNKHYAPSPPESLGRQAGRHQLDTAARQDLADLLSGMAPRTVTSPSPRPHAENHVQEEPIVATVLTREQSLMARDAVTRWLNAERHPPLPSPSPFQRLVGHVMDAGDKPENEETASSSGHTDGAADTQREQLQGHSISSNDTCITELTETVVSQTVQVAADTAPPPPPTNAEPLQPSQETFAQSPRSPKDSQLLSTQIIVVDQKTSAENKDSAPEGTHITVTTTNRPSAVLGTGTESDSSREKSAESKDPASEETSLVMTEKSAASTDQRRPQSPPLLENGTDSKDPAPEGTPDISTAAAAAASEKGTESSDSPRENGADDTGPAPRDATRIAIKNRSALITPLQSGEATPAPSSRTPVVTATSSAPAPHPSPPKERSSSHRGSRAPPAKVASLSQTSFRTSRPLAKLGSLSLTGRTPALSSLSSSISSSPSSSVPRLPPRVDAYAKTRNDQSPFLVEVLKGIVGLGIKVKVNREGHVEVTEVQRNSPVDKNGNVRAGDYLLCINTTELRGLTDGRVQQVLRLLPRGLIKLVVSTEPPPPLSGQGNDPSERASPRSGGAYSQFGVRLSPRPFSPSAEKECPPLASPPAVQDAAVPSLTTAPAESSHRSSAAVSSADQQSVAIPRLTPSSSSSASSDRVPVDVRPSTALSVRGRCCPRHVIPSEKPQEAAEKTREAVEKPREAAEKPKEEKPREVAAEKPREAVDKAREAVDKPEEAVKHRDAAEKPREVAEKPREAGEKPRQTDRTRDEEESAPQRPCSLETDTPRSPRSPTRLPDPDRDRRTDSTPAVTSPREDASPLALSPRLSPARTRSPEPPSLSPSPSPPKPAPRQRTTTIAQGKENGGGGGGGEGGSDDGAASSSSQRAERHLTASEIVAAASRHPSGGDDDLDLAPLSPTPGKEEGARKERRRSPRDARDLSPAVDSTSTARAGGTREEVSSLEQGPVPKRSPVPAPRPRSRVAADAKQGRSHVQGNEGEGQRPVEPPPRVGAISPEKALDGGGGDAVVHAHMVTILPRQPAAPSSTEAPSPKDSSSPRVTRRARQSQHSDGASAAPSPSEALHLKDSSSPPVTRRARQFQHSDSASAAPFPSEALHLKDSSSPPVTRRARQSQHSDSASAAPSPSEALHLKDSSSPPVTRRARQSQHSDGAAPLPSPTLVPSRLRPFADPNVPTLQDQAPNRRFVSNAARMFEQKVSESSSAPPLSKNRKSSVSVSSVVRSLNSQDAESSSGVTMRRKAVGRGGEYSERRRSMPGYFTGSALSGTLSDTRGLSASTANINATHPERDHPLNSALSPRTARSSTTTTATTPLRSFTASRDLNHHPGGRRSQSPPSVGKSGESRRTSMSAVTHRSRSSTTSSLLHDPHRFISPSSHRQSWSPHTSEALSPRSSRTPPSQRRADRLGSSLSVSMTSLVSPHHADSSRSPPRHAPSSRSPPRHTSSSRSPPRHAPSSRSPPRHAPSSRSAHEDFTAVRKFDDLLSYRHALDSDDELPKVSNSLASSVLKKTAPHSTDATEVNRKAEAGRSSEEQPSVKRERRTAQHPTQINRETDHHHHPASRTNVVTPGEDQTSDLRSCPRTPDEFVVEERTIFTFSDSDARAKAEDVSERSSALPAAGEDDAQSARRAAPPSSTSDTVHEAVVGSIVSQGLQRRTRRAKDTTNDQTHTGTTVNQRTDADTTEPQPSVVHAHLVSVDAMSDNYAVRSREVEAQDTGEVTLGRHQQQVPASKREVKDTEDVCPKEDAVNIKGTEQDLSHEHDVTSSPDLGPDTASMKQTAPVPTEADQTDTQVPEVSEESEEDDDSPPPPLPDEGPPPLPGAPPPPLALSRDVDTLTDVGDLLPSQETAAGQREVGVSDARPADSTRAAVAEDVDVDTLQSGVSALNFSNPQQHAMTDQKDQERESDTEPLPPHSSPPPPHPGPPPPPTHTDLLKEGERKGEEFRTKEGDDPGQENPPVSDTLSQDSGVQDEDMSEDGLRLTMDDSLTTSSLFDAAMTPDEVPVSVLGQSPEGQVQDTHVHVHTDKVPSTRPVASPRRSAMHASPSPASPRSPRTTTDSTVDVVGDSQSSRTVALSNIGDVSPQGSASPRCSSGPEKAETAEFPGGVSTTGEAVSAESTPHAVRKHTERSAEGGPHAVQRSTERSAETHDTPVKVRTGKDAGEKDETKTEVRREPRRTQANETARVETSKTVTDNHTLTEPASPPLSPTEEDDDHEDSEEDPEVPTSQDTAFSPQGPNTAVLTSPRKWCILDQSGSLFLQGSPQAPVTLTRSMVRQVTSLTPKDLVEAVLAANGDLDQAKLPQALELRVVSARELSGRPVHLDVAQREDYFVQVTRVHSKGSSVQEADLLLSVDGHVQRHRRPAQVHSQLDDTGPKGVLLTARGLRLPPSVASALAAADEGREVTTSTPAASTPPSSSSSSRAVLVGEGVYEVTLTKGPAGVGFCLEGGKASPRGDLPILIKRIFKGGPAEKGGVLKVKDELVSVNGEDYTALRHYEAWNHLKAVPDGDITLRFRREDQ
ncbi:uncharacterized protein LOC143282289 [Babylonia areolata]|uniref:uncharacterized protein LOC143282289 n=1 Tax=Babylonia areolata TaxID=304850 RepID=UPI003FD09A90